MHKFNYEKVNDLIQPLMNFMRDEFPNNYILTITSEYAELQNQVGVLNFIKEADKNDKSSKED